MLEVDPEEALAYGLFSRRQARAAGLSAAEIDLKVRKGEWIRPERRLLSVAGRTDRSGDDVVRAVLRAGPRAVVSHASAAVAHGWDLLRSPDRIELIVPRTHGGASAKGARIRHIDLSESDVETVGVLPLTTAVRTAVDVMATQEPVEAVVAVDSALRLQQVTLSDLQAEVNSRRSMPQRRAVDGALAQLSLDSGSAPESVARLLFASAGFALPVCQFTVRRDGRFVARVDFAWPHQRLVVEVDGFAWHSSHDAFQRDRTRQNAVQLAGYRILRFTAADVLYRPEQVVAVVAEALGQ